MSKSKQKKRKNSRRATRQATKETSELQQAWKAEAKEKKRLRKEAFNRTFEKARRRPSGPRALVEKSLSDDRHFTGPLFNHPIAGKLKNDKLVRILWALVDKAPKLVDTDYVTALYWVSRLDWVRSLDEWKPKGKGRDSLFYSLVGHLLAKYPTPRLLFSGFFGQPAEKLHEFIGFVAAGGSPFKAVKNGLVPVPLTKRMCHGLMTATGRTSLMEAIRAVQVEAFGGDRRMLQSWMMTTYGPELHRPQDEEFWATVLHWFCQNPMLDRAQVSPLLDFIGYRRRQDINFSMAGRSALALIRGMKEWHGDLAKAKSIKGKIFQPCGFHNKSYIRKTRTQAGNHIEEHWKVTELLTSKELLAEGRALKHCVYSYAWRIEDGRVSIWSMTTGYDPEHQDRCLTIEVINEQRAIVQARGACNRMPSNAEYRILQKWAGENNLTIASNRMV